MGTQGNKQKAAISSFTAPLQNSEVKWVLSAMREPVLKKSNYFRVPLVVLQVGVRG